MVTFVSDSGGTQLKTLTDDVEIFIRDFGDQLRALVVHDHISKIQTNNLKKQTQPENLGEHDIIAIYDFSQNHAFVLQDSIQAAYFDQRQCTIHPICLYFKEGNAYKKQSIIVIAESLQHTVHTVYLIQQKMIEYLKQRFGSDFAKKTIKFFSDGAASQYKNKYNFFNLCMFKKDFGIDAEWHFFATSHGKTANDALGGSFKRNARNYNLKTKEDQITNSLELYNWAKKDEESVVHYIYISEKEHTTNYKKMESRFHKNSIITVQGTLNFHFFKPVDQKKIEARVHSDSQVKEVFNLTK